MKDPTDLVAGFRRFQQRYFGRERALYERLVRQGQSPKVMVVACCDSRVDPAIITDCDPGDLFVVRNVANLVPPCEGGGGYHGTSAALEFAVRYLQVEHVIIMGHARCSGIRALIDDARRGGNVGQFISPWMSIADDARREVLAALPEATAEAQAAACERAALRVSLRNVMSFPFVQEAVEHGRLTVLGWYFDIDRGELLRCTPESPTLTVIASHASD
jgi:carbonic anhydrase